MASAVSGPFPAAGRPRRRSQHQTPAGYIHSLNRRTEAARCSRTSGGGLKPGGSRPRSARPQGTGTGVQFNHRYFRGGDPHFRAPGRSAISRLSVQGNIQVPGGQKVV